MVQVPLSGAEPGPGVDVNQQEEQGNQSAVKSALLLSIFRTFKVGITELCSQHPMAEGRMHPLSAFCGDCGIPTFRDHQTVGVSLDVSYVGVAF